MNANLSPWLLSQATMIVFTSASASIVFLSFGGIP